MEKVKTYEELLAAGDFIKYKNSEFWDNWEACKKLISESSEKIYIYTVINGEGSSSVIAEGVYWADRLGYLFSKKHVAIDDFTIEW